MERAFHRSRCGPAPFLNRTSAVSLRCSPYSATRCARNGCAAEVFRGRTGLTGSVDFRLLAALLLSGIPLRAGTLPLTAHDTLTGHQSIDTQQGGLLDLHAGVASKGSLLKTGDGLLKLGGTNSLFGEIVPKQRGTGRGPTREKDTRQHTLCRAGCTSPTPLPRHGQKIPPIHRRISHRRASQASCEAGNRRVAVPAASARSSGWCA